MSSSSLYKLCSKPIKFDDKHISERTGKRIPLDLDIEQPHDCPVWKGSQQYKQPPQQQQSQQQQERRYHQCNKGCGVEIYFDVKQVKKIDPQVKIILMSSFEIDD